MDDVNEMEQFWTSEINKCLDIIAPMKVKKSSRKKVTLPQEVQLQLKERNLQRKKLQDMQNSGNVDRNFEKDFKKYNNFCNNLVKKSVKQACGKNITKESSVNDVWKAVRYVLKPESTARNQLKINVENKVIEDPQVLAEEFNNFFKNKIEKLREGIKRDPTVDPVSKLRQKYKNVGLLFSLKTVSVQEVRKEINQLKSKTSSGFDGISAEILKLGAEVLAAPLTHIINKSIQSGNFPTKWKESKVVPLHKKGDKKTLQNYRPVALLSVAGMVCERIVALQIEEHFERNQLFSEFQFGFRSGKSTVSELLTLFENLLEAKQDKSFIMLVMYDLSAAFDTISHDILCEKLKVYGFDDGSMNWIRSYLQGRKQRVTVGSKTSEPLNIEIGTPQGSRLSPLLFICLMADLELWTDSMLSNFADDTQSIIIEQNEDEAIQSTKKEANKVISFFSANDLVNNSDKAALLVNINGKGAEVEIDGIGGVALQSKSSEKLLGIHINSNLDWKTHVEKISPVLKSRIGLLKRLSYKVPRDKLFIIAEAIFNSKIRYGISVYLKPTFEEEELKSGYQHKETKILQVIQNDMIRTICGIRRDQKVNLKRLREKWKMMSVNQLSVYHTLIETYNVIMKSSSEKIRRKIMNDKQEHAYQLRSSSNNNLIVLAKPRLKCQGFSYSAAKLYNKLPNNIRNASENVFKSTVKAWIWENIPSA